MATGISTPQHAPLTRPSGLGAVGWLLPLVLVLPAVLLCVLAVHQLDRLYRADAGVLRAEQLVPYPLALRYGDIGHDDPVSSARLTAAQRRWQAQGEASAERAATVAWRERGGRPDVVVVAALDDDPARVAAGLRDHARPGEQVRVWREGDRAVVAMVASSSGAEAW